jgi:hydrogenase maturation factor
LAPDLLAAVLAAGLPVPPEVEVGPGVGEDACAIAIGAGHLIATSDPITLTNADVGRLAALVNANDVAVMGARPRWFLATVLLPIGTTEADVRDLFASLHAALDELDVALVGGHTEVTDAVRQPVVAGHMLGLLAEGERVVTTAGARPGDVVVQIGLVPVEGAIVLARATGRELPAGGPGIGVVDAALAAAELGATSLHDPTEGGLAGALHELAEAAGVGLRIDRARVAWYEPGVALCHECDLDPWATLASGAVLATFAVDQVAGAAQELERRGFAVAEIGSVEPGTGVTDTDGARVGRPERDEVARWLERA